MVGLFSVARGLERTVDTTFNRIPGLLVLQPGAPIPLFSRLPKRWGGEIASVEGAEVVNAEVWQRANLINGKMVISPPRFLFGTDIETRRQLKGDPYQIDLKSGRFLEPDDRGTHNTVISRDIADSLQMDVGGTFMVNAQRLTIVGIYDCGSPLFDVAIILDIETVRTMSRFDAESVSSFYVEPGAGIEKDALIARIKSIFQGREVAPASMLGSTTLGPADGLTGFFRALDKTIKSIPRTTPPESSDSSDGRRAAAEKPSQQLDDENATETSQSLPIDVRTAADWADRFEEFSSDLNLFLTVMTSIGVIIAVLSIVNTMLMSVTERFIEFGILKANGWTRSDVVKLITCESALLGVGGGVLGALVGWTAVQVINGQWPDRIQLYASPGLLAFSVAFSVGLGILGGLYPAMWAMRMLPMDAIRRG
jgi:putative ABC transport system permease protein